MSYCVNCGVELDPSQQRCPLCGVKVVNPAAPKNTVQENMYPESKVAQPTLAKKKVAALISAILLLIPMLTPTICDLDINGSVTWSRYVLISFIPIYSIFFSPMIFRAHRWTYSIVLDFLSVSLALWCICRFNGGSWFWAFALPVAAILHILVYGVYILAKHSPWNMTKIFASVIGSCGLFTLLVEWLLNCSFFPGKHLEWSLYTIIPCVVISAVLFIIDKNTHFKEALEKRFFV